jgi:hypothetical protein
LGTTGQVLQDMRLTNGAKIFVRAQNVTIRRVELLGGSINNDVTACGNGLVIEDTSILPTSPGAATNDGEGVISYGGYTARRVEINGRNEGFRVSSVDRGCGPVVIENSFAKIVPPTGCGDWHGDGIQGYNGAGVTVRNVTIDMTIVAGCGGTSPFWWPSGQGNTGTVTVDRFLVMGQGYAFRLGMPATVAGLRIVNNSWEFGPTDVWSCTQIPIWEAKIVTIDQNYAVTSIVRDQPCR